MYSVYVHVQEVHYSNALLYHKYANIKVKYCMIQNFGEFDELQEIC